MRGKALTTSRLLPGEDLVVVDVMQQRYAVSVRQVREVVPRAALTPLPGAPDGVLGILSLRGTLLPVIDLRHQVGLPPVAPSVTQCILIVELARCTVGLLVDAAIGIVSLARAGAATADEGPAPLVREVREIDGHVVSILDADVVVGPTIAAYVVALTSGPAGTVSTRVTQSDREGSRR